MILPKTQTDATADIELSIQKFMIDYSFKDIQSWTDDGKLLVRYELKDSNWKGTYLIGVTYQPFKEPKAFVLKPEIEPSLSIHMYQNRSLCLYHRTDFKIFDKISVARQIIPWTIEWVHFYELWLINGNIWKGKEIGHGL